MKQLLEILPKLLGMMPEIAKFIKIIPIIMLLAGLGYGIYYFFLTYKDPFMCVDNEIYEQLRFDSQVYRFKGGYCVGPQQ